MEVRNLTRARLDNAAKLVDAKVENYREKTLRNGMTVANFVIRPNWTSKKDPQTKEKVYHPYVTFGHNSRVISAICFHGHGKFMRELFKQGATKIQSCTERFDNLEQLEDRIYRGQQTAFNNRAYCDC